MQNLGGTWNAFNLTCDQAQGIRSNASTESASGKFSQWKTYVSASKYNFDVVHSSQFRAPQNSAPDALHHLAAP